MVSGRRTDGYSLGMFASKVTIVRRKPGETQPGSYNRVLRSIRRKCSWAAVLDVDEFLYSRSPNGLSVVPALKKVRSRVSSIMIRSRTFLPTESFTDPHSKILALTYVYPKIDVRAKSIHRLSMVQRVTVHRVKTSSGIVKNGLPGVTINHYRFPSYEAVFGNKEGKGGRKY